MIIGGDRMKILLIYNPTAGHGRAGRALPKIQQQCADLGICIETRLTEHKGHTTENSKVISPDGELFGTTPGEVRCLHRALSVFA